MARARFTYVWAPGRTRSALFLRDKILAYYAWSTVPFGRSGPDTDSLSERLDNSRLRLTLQATSFKQEHQNTMGENSCKRC